jgi:hypothetical protein
MILNDFMLKKDEKYLAQEDDDQTEENEEIKL